MAHLKPGDSAPDFTLVDQNGNRVSLAEFRGRKLLVYFYPKADTPGCTQQACSLRDAQPDFSGLGIAVVGISPDLPDAQKKFDDKYNLGFPLLSDADHRIAGAWGVWGEKSRYGKTYEGIIRSSFVVDEAGRILGAWYSVKPLDTVSNAMKVLSGS